MNVNDVFIMLMLQYSLSPNCMMELRFAICSVEMPVIVLVVGTGNKWMWDEVEFSVLLFLT